jgi:Holliday junction resolvase RusA-like endonuclease
VFTEITLPGRPITKKNSQVRTKWGGVIQSKQYREYEERCLQEMMTYRGPRFGYKQVSVQAVYYMPNRRSWPDLMGLLQATCDILEKAGIYDNDRQVVRLDGSKIAGVDRERPRVEIKVEEEVPF